MLELKPNSLLFVDLGGMNSARVSTKNVSFMIRAMADGAVFGMPMISAPKSIHVLEFVLNY
jgi:hypothetical protein